MSDTPTPSTPSTDLGERFPKTAEEMSRLRGAGVAAARDLGAFIDASPTPFHAVREAARRLELAGFRELFETDTWQLAAGDRRYVIRGGSTILAFIVGDESPATGGFR